MEINEIVSAIENLTLIQASELVKALEEKFGVTAAAPVAAAAGGAAPAVRGHYLYGGAPFSLDFARAALLRNPATTRHELD